MAGSVWPTLVAGARAKASEVEAKFDWIEGDIVPMAGGSQVDSTYDLGNSSFRWRDVYSSRQFLAGLGSIGTPSFSFQGRTTDGWYSPAANQMGLTLNGVQWINYRDNAGILEVDGGQSWSRGIDTADSNAYKISVGTSIATVTALKIFTTGEITKPLQPAFLAECDTEFTMSSSGTITAFNTEIYDVGSDFSSNRFTAPVSGKYLFTVSLGLNHAGTSVGVIQINLVTTSRTYELQRVTHEAAALASTTSFGYCGSLIVNMGSADTAYLLCAVASSFVYINATESTWSGCLIA